jgi:hypothetical protein
VLIFGHVGIIAATSHIRKQKTDKRMLLQGPSTLLLIHQFTNQLIT